MHTRFQIRRTCESDISKRAAVAKRHGQRQRPASPPITVKNAKRKKELKNRAKQSRRFICLFIYLFIYYHFEIIL